MTRSILIPFAAALFCAVSAHSGENAHSWTWGTAAGSPQTLALTLERRSETPVRFQAHAGTIVVVSSLGIRALVVASRRRVAPYAFAGGGWMYVAEGEGGGPLGSSGYGWAGAGLRFGTGGLAWFGELGVLWGMNTGNGYDATLPGAAVGVAFGAP